MTSMRGTAHTVTDTGEARNQKHEIRNKFKMKKKESLKRISPFGAFSFVLRMCLVSCFSSHSVPGGLNGFRLHRHRGQ